MINFCDKILTIKLKDDVDMSKKLTEKMWIDVKSADEDKTTQSEQPVLATAEEYVLFAETLIAGKNEEVNDALKTLTETSESLTSTIANNNKWSDPYFNSQMDVLHMSACRIDGEFYTERRMFEEVKKQSTDEDGEYINDLHAQCEQKSKQYGEIIDRKIETPQAAREEYLASIGRSKI